MAQKGMSEILGKVRTPKRVKEATAMNEAYEQTQTFVQYWQAVEVELAKRKAAYERNIERYRSLGGNCRGMGDDLELALGGVAVVVRMDPAGQVIAVESRVQVGSTDDDMREISNAYTAVLGLAKSEQVIAQIKEQRAYVENDGYIRGMNALVNRTVLNNPVLTALTMVPDNGSAGAAED